MNEKKIIQQEIAPLDISQKSEKPLPVEKKQKTAAFFKLSPTQKITYTSILVAVSVVTKIYSIPIIPNVAYISFFYIPIFIAGIFLGPSTGFAVGILGDLIGAMIAPKGAYLPLIGLSSGLIGLIPGALFIIKSDNKIVNSFIFKTIASMVLVLIICTAALNTFALWWWFSSRSKTFWAYLLVRFPWQALVASINTVIICMLNPLLIKIMRKA